MTQQATAQANVEKWIGQYVQIRDKLKMMDEAHSKSREPLVDIQNILTGLLQKFMDDANCSSVKTGTGTAYSSTKHSASVADSKAFMQFVIDHNAWELLDKRANSTAVKAYVEEKGVLPPGVNLSAIATIGVRRG